MTGINTSELEAALESRLDEMMVTAAAAIRAALKRGDNVTINTIPRVIAPSLRVAGCLFVNGLYGGSITDG